jgi:hypothetical protein
MNQKNLAIVVVVVVAIAVVAVGAYWVLNSDNGDNNGVTNVDDASSLQFAVSIVREGEDFETTYSAKNIGTSDLMMRIEIATIEGDIIYIVNGAQQKAWANIAGEWMDLSDTFLNEWDMWNLTLDDYADNLSSWTGVGDWTYNDTDGSAVTIHDITVDPSLADSLFEP